MHRLFRDDNVEQPFGDLGQVHGVWMRRDQRGPGLVGIQGDAPEGSRSVGALQSEMVSVVANVVAGPCLGDGAGPWRRFPMRRRVVAF